MTIGQLAQLLGRTGLLEVDGLRVPVIITDAKRAYGVLRYEVRPNHKRRDLGKVWVNAARVTLED